MPQRALPTLLLTWTLAAVGCPTGADDDAGDDDAGDDDDGGQTHAVIATTDFAVGALASVDLDDGTVVDEITATSGDPVVWSDGGRVFQLNRFMFDSVRVHEPPALEVPALEFSTGAGSNPYAVAWCAGALFVVRYDRDSIGIYDPASGLPVGEVDLAPWADADGLPEASTLVRRGETLYVGLERLDRDGEVWLPAPGGGAVLEVDCAAREVVREWATGPNVKVQAHPWRDDALLLIEGVLFETWNVPALDGGVRTLDLTSGALGAVDLDEQAIGENIVGVAADAQGRGVLVSAGSETHTIHCLDMTDWSVETAAVTDYFIPEVRSNDRGEAWLPMRAGPADPGTPGGIAVYDLASCEERAGGLIGFSLDPFSVAFY